MAQLLSDASSRRLQQLAALPWAPAEGAETKRSEDAPGGPPWQRKQDLFKVCTQLPLRDSNRLVALVQSKCPKAIRVSGKPTPAEPDAQQASVDLDLLDLEAFEQLEKLALERQQAIFEQQMELS